MAKLKRRHEIVLVVRTDRPCSKAEAIDLVKDNIWGTFYVAHDEVQVLTVKTAKAQFSKGAGSH